MMDMCTHVWRVCVWHACGWHAEKEKRNKEKKALIWVWWTCAHVGMQMHCMWTQISMKKKKQRKSVLTWLLKIDLCMCAGGRWTHSCLDVHCMCVTVWMNGLACRCVDVWMHCMCIQTCMSGEKKKKKYNLLMGWGWTCRGMGMQMATLVCGHGCVACGWGWVERRKKKKTYFVNVDGGHVGLQTCCMWMQMSRKERWKKNLL